MKWLATLLNYNLYILSMFHVKQYKIHSLLFLLLLILLPIQTRTLFNPELAYTGWYFNYHNAYFFYLTDILVITLIVSWAIFEKPWKKAKKGWIWLILLLFPVTIGLFHVKHLGFSLYETFKLLEIVALIAYISLEINRTTLPIAIFSLFIGGIIQSLLGIFQFHMQHGLNLSTFGEYLPSVDVSGAATLDLEGGKRLRAYGTFPHPNVLAGYLYLCFVLGLSLIVSHATKWKKYVLYIGLFCITIGIFLSFSRVVWGITAVSLILSTLFYVKHSKFKALATIFVLILVSCATILLNYNEYLVQRIDPGSDPKAITDRLLFNRYALQIAKENPITGTGIGNYIFEMQTRFKLEPWQYQPPHNIFILITAQFGLVGLVIFALLMYKIFRSTWNKYYQSESFFVLLAGISILLISSFDHYFATIQQGRLIFAVILGLMLAVGKFQPNETSIDNQKLSS